MHVSKLLDWYSKDLTDPNTSPHRESVAKFLSNNVDGETLARSLSNDVWTKTYIEYDWTLNLQH